MCQECIIQDCSRNCKLFFSFFCPLSRTFAHSCRKFCCQGQSRGAPRLLYSHYKGRGLCGPCTPHQGHRPWTRCATYNRIEQSCFRMKCGETKDSTTGTMKTKKRREKKRTFSSGVYFVFPGCFASGWRCSTAQPVCGRQWRSQFAILQFAFAKGSLRVSWRGDDNPSVPAGQLPLQWGECKGWSYPSLCTKEIPKQQARQGLLFLVLRDRMKATNKNLTTRWFILWLM